jgi:predicted MFS family arabinose efflux permease
VIVISVESDTVAGSLPEIAHDLDEPITVVELVASACALSTALLASILRSLPERRGRRAALPIGLAILACSVAVDVVARPWSCSFGPWRQGREQGPSGQCRLPSVHSDS